ncbi:MAG: thioesterase family protein [Stagnimonas sp.]|nr:thioesterase family protein [Stagnimonas sp.]
MSARPFRYLLRVRYPECDAQKVVFNARYGEYVDLAFGEFLRTLGYWEGGPEPVPEVQLVKQTTEWFGPARYDQVLDISVSLFKLGTTSFTLLSEFRIAGHEPLSARTETVYVHVDPRLFQKAPLPGGLRTRLEAGAPGQHVDHAAHYQRTLPPS